MEQSSPRFDLTAYHVDQKSFGTIIHLRCDTAGAGSWQPRRRNFTPLGRPSPPDLKSVQALAAVERAGSTLNFSRYVHKASWPLPPAPSGLVSLLDNAHAGVQLRVLTFSLRVF